MVDRDVHCWQVDWLTRRLVQPNTVITPDGGRRCDHIATDPEMGATQGVPVSKREAIAVKATRIDRATNFLNAIPAAL